MIMCTIYRNSKEKNYTTNSELKISRRSSPSKVKKTYSNTMFKKYQQSMYKSTKSSENVFETITEFFRKISFEKMVRGIT